MLKDCHHKPLKGALICETCQMPDEWQRHAKCLDADPDLFYCADDDVIQIKRAIRICLSCPVRGFCLELGWKDKFGIWGSFTAPERERLRKVFALQTDAKNRRKIIRTIAHRL